ncbi:MAG: hypothetical protein ACRC9X_04290 [Bacteroidales bacterium]
MKDNTHSPFQTPEGYFEQLPSSIMQRVAPLSIKVSKWTKVRSQLAFAASFTLLAGIASLVLHMAGKENEIDDSQYLAYSLSVMDVEEYVWNSLHEINSTTEGSLSEDAVMDYLLAESWIDE